MGAGRGTAALAQSPESRSEAVPEHRLLRHEEAPSAHGRCEWDGKGCITALGE